MIRSFLSFKSQILKHQINLFSTSTAISQSLPSNLRLADTTVLEAIKPPKISKLDTLFPRINVPATIPVSIFKKPGEFTDSVAISSKIFGMAIRKDIILDAIRYHRHKLRQPKKTKRKSEIAGSNKKPWAQKGR